MNLKNSTIPELLDVLHALLNRVINDKDRVINDKDRANIALLADQRTFTREEKILISTYCKRYNITQEFIDTQLLR